MSSFILQGGLVLRAWDQPARHESILIENGRIARFLACDAQLSGVPVVDATSMLIHPGLINAHAHSHTTLTKGTADRWSLELLLASGAGIYGGRSARDRYLSTLLGAAELALKGCTAIYDMCLEMPLPTVAGMRSTASAYQDVGTRAVIAPMLADISFWEAIPGLADELAPDLRQRLTAGLPASGDLLGAVRAILDQWDSPLQRPALGPTIPLHGSDALWTGCRDLAQEYGLAMQVHLQESKVQALAGAQHYGRSLTAHLDDLGVLGPHFTAAHGVWLDGDDMRRLGIAGASVSHNPGSNMILGSGLADVRAMIEHGINVALGTDGANCADNLNMYESMRTALRVSHVRTPRMEQWLSAPEVFRMATENGAQALGLEGVGRLAEGYHADLVMLDLGHVNWLPTNDVISQLVQSEDGTAVHRVMVAGKWIVRDGELTNVALRELRGEIQSALADLRNRNGDQLALFERLKPVLSSFCPAMMRKPYTVERFGAAYPAAGDPPG